METMRWHCRVDLPDHASLSSSNSQMRIFRPVIQTLMRTMLDTGHDFPFGCVVGSELIGDHDTRCDALGDALALQELSHQLQDCLLVPAALDQGIKNITIGIDGPPQPVFSALNNNDHFVEMPVVGKTSPGPSPDGTRIFSAELGSPFRDSLERDFNAALSQQIFDMTQT
jgi:hypothetical protein